MRSVINRSQNPNATWRRKSKTQNSQSHQSLEYISGYYKKKKKGWLYSLMYFC